MSQFMSRKAQRISPYIPGEQSNQSNLIKLNTNENPYLPSPNVQEAVEQQIARLHLYPEIDGKTLRTSIAAREKISPESVFVGNGSDEVLSLCFPAFFNNDEQLYLPELTYTFYEIYAALFDIPFTLVPMKATLEVDVGALLAGEGPVMVANPNAPTSLELPIETIEHMAQKQLEKGKVLIVDEAYIAFGAQPSAVTLIDRYPNLLVTRTMSKSHALAGMRVGYAIGQPHLIDALIRIKDSFNSYPLDRLAIVGAAAAIDDEAYLQKRLAMIVHTRDEFAAGLAKRGFDVMRSSTNFLFVKHPNVSGKQIFDELRERNILVRRFDKPQISEYLRISIGTDEQMAKVLCAIDEILA